MLRVVADMAGRINGEKAYIYTPGSQVSFILLEKDKSKVKYSFIKVSPLLKGPAISD